MEQEIFLAQQIFDGDQFLNDVGIVVKKGRVESIIPGKTLSVEDKITTLPGDIVVPGFQDLQINGAGGLMFSADPTVEALQEIYAYSLAGGATKFMATVPTNSLPLIKRAVQAVQAYWQKGLPGLLGLHLEGPYINPAKKGAHIEEFITVPTLENVQELLEMGEETIKMMTLAPECCPDEVIKYLVKKGLILSAGHSNATYDEAVKGFSLGIAMCTHLYNAMSPLTHKDAGLVGAAFDDSSIYAGIIVDNVHVNPTAAKVAHQIMSNRLCYVTDAVTEVDSETYHYQLAGDRYVTEQGTLAGSCLKMQNAVQNAIALGVSPKEALNSATLHPAKILNRDHLYGKIAPGYAVDWAVLDKNYNVIETRTA